MENRWRCRDVRWQVSRAQTLQDWAVTVRDWGLNLDCVFPWNFLHMEIPGGARPWAHSRCIPWSVNRRHWRSRAQGQNTEVIISQQPFTIFLKARGKKNTSNAIASPIRACKHTQLGEARPKCSTTQRTREPSRSSLVFVLPFPDP